MSNRKAIILSLLFSMATTVAFGQKCDCLEELKFAQTKIEQNYSGFKDKVTASNQALYQAHNEQYLRAAKKINDPFQCAQHVRRWTKIFNEGNIRLENNRPDLESWKDNELQSYFANTRTMPKWDEAKIKKYLSSGSLDSIEGIWANKSRTYVTAIIKKPKSKTNRDFVGIILKADGVFWQQGMIKMDIAKNEKYEVDFYYRDHDARTLEGILTNGAVLELKGLTHWEKIFPEVHDSLKLAFNPNYYDKIFETKKHNCSVFDKETAILSLPSFKGEFAPTIDSLIKANWTTITDSKNLIIDLRGNDGGNDYTFAPLLPIIYTHPIYTEGIAIYSSPDNIRSWEVMIDHPKISQDIKNRIRELVEKMKLNVGKFIEVPGETTNFDKPLAFPSNVGLLVDNKCEGSTEQFLQLAKQSDKVTIFGQPTAGILDYGHMRSARMPCLPYTLKYATSRSNRLPHRAINPTGVIPNVKLDEGEWIEIVAGYLNKLAEK